jgi:hypothetical protein
MKFIVVCTEGLNSEPEYIETFCKLAIPSIPGHVSAPPEIIILPLGGNQGHRAIIDKVNKKYQEWEKADNSIYEYFDPETDKVEKYLVCDYDNMHKKGIELKDFRRDVEAAGYDLILTKPGFELFLMLHFVSIEDAICMKPENFIDEINKKIELLNRELPPGVDISKYSKHERSASRCFGMLFSFRPNYIQKVLQLPMSVETKYFSEMPRLLNSIIEGYSDE